MVLYPIHNQRTLEISKISSLSPQLQESSSQEMYFFASGREAIVSLRQAIKFDHDPVVLLPAFVPEGIYAPFLSPPWQIILYKVTRALDPVWEHLEALLRQHKPKIAVLIHYFGLPKPIRQFVDICRVHGTLVVEDMAHAYLNETLGKNGDFILYSLPKMIGVPDGAALAVRKSNGMYDIPETHESFLHRIYIIQQMANMIITTVESHTPVFPGSTEILRLLRRMPGSSYKTLMKYYTKPAPMSKLSCFLLRHIDHKSVKLKRQELARIYVNGLDRSKFQFFPCADSPLNVMMGFPVSIKNREAFIKYLARKSISGVVFVYKWNFIPDEQKDFYSDAIEILNSHFLFPLHQQLSWAQVQHVVDVANRWDGD